MYAIPLIGRTENKDGKCTVTLLPQHLANLTQPMGSKQVIYFWKTHLCADNIVYGMFMIDRSL